MVVPLALAATTAAVAGLVVWSGRGDTPAAGAGAPDPVRTAAVERTDVSTTRSLNGTLGFGAAEPVKGGKEGVVTWLPRLGTRVDRGKQLFRVDDRPVPLFYGTVPLYRELGQRGTVGRDVRMIATNLQRMGYVIGTQPGPGTTVTSTGPAPQTPATGSAPPVPPSPATVRVTVRKGEGVLTSALITAIRKWQRDTHLPETGRIGIGDVVVRPGALRIASVTAQLGDSAAGPLLTATPTAKVITVSAAAAEAGTIQRGDPVTVVLPGDTKVPGRVSAIGTALLTDAAEGPDEPARRAITVTVDDEAGLNGIDAADVQVDVTGEIREGVLAVPVGALVALREGGYAVQIAGGGLIPVTVGIFDQGMVEVTGAGLAEGTAVVTTS